MLFSNLFTKEHGEPVIHNTALEKMVGKPCRLSITAKLTYNISKDDEIALGCVVSLRLLPVGCLDLSFVDYLGGLPQKVYAEAAIIHTQTNQ